MPGLQAQTTVSALLSALIPNASDIQLGENTSLCFRLFPCREDSKISTSWAEDSLKTSWSGGHGHKIVHWCLELVVLSRAGLVTERGAHVQVYSSVPSVIM